MLLEKRLEDIDGEETRMLFLASSRLDRNEKRKEVMKEIDQSLMDYGIVRSLYTVFTLRLRCLVANRILFQIPSFREVLKSCRPRHRSPERSKTYKTGLMATRV